MDRSDFVFLCLCWCANWRTHLSQHQSPSRMANLLEMKQIDLGRYHMREFSAENIDSPQSSWWMLKPGIGIWFQSEMNAVFFVHRILGFVSSNFIAQFVY